MYAFKHYYYLKFLCVHIVCAAVKIKNKKIVKQKIKINLYGHIHTQGTNKEI